MQSPLIVVEAFIPPPRERIDLRHEVWSIALDQRAFGPRQLLVALATRRGGLRALAHTSRTDPPEDALARCLQHLHRGAKAAVALCDEPVADGPPPPGLAERFAVARSIAASFGVHLVDWIACDDQLFRSTRLAVDPHCEWWDVP